MLATGVHGTRLVGVNGNYDDVNRLCTELSGDHDWAFVNINMRPYYAEGSKTLAFETAEQLGWQSSPTAASCRSPRARCSRKSHAASKSGVEVGLVDGELPKMSGAQAAGCSPVATRRVRRRATTSAARCKPSTIAKSLAIGGHSTAPTRSTSPAARGGAIDAVTDEEIKRRDQAAGRDDRACSPRPQAG